MIRMSTTKGVRLGNQDSAKSILTRANNAGLAKSRRLSGSARHPLRGRPNAHEHNKANVGPHSGSVIWALWRFNSPFAERASPLHLFEPERIGCGSYDRGVPRSTTPSSQTALVPQSESDFIQRPLPAISDRCQSSSVRFARRPDLQELP